MGHQPTPQFIFQNYIQTFEPMRAGNNSVLVVDGPNPVTSTGQNLTFTFNSPIYEVGQPPFSVQVERFDPDAYVMSAVTLEGHPLAGWRYWRVYLSPTLTRIVETGACDTNAPGPINWALFHVFKGTVLKNWEEYLLYIRKKLSAQEGGIYDLVKGEYNDNQHDYILNQVCQSTSCH